MRSLIVAALIALLAPAAAHAGVFAERAALTHGIAGDERYVFTTEPGIGSAARVVVLDRTSGREVATLPPPRGGFKLPFTLRVPRSGRLVVLDNGGFPPVGPPVVYDYAYGAQRGRFSARLARTVDFKGLPLQFAEDVEVLPTGEYVVSESIAGGLWLIGRDGRIRRGLVPDAGAPPLPRLGPCPLLGSTTVGGLPFSAPGGFAPGAGSLAVRGGELYFSSSCEGGIYRVPLKVLLDARRPAAARAAQIATVSPRQFPFESLKGITFNRWDPRDPWLYAGDPFRLSLVRVHSVTGRREVLSTDARLYDFTVSTAFLPPQRRGGPNPLVTASDQEYRWTATNAAITTDQLRPPFVLAQYWPPRR
ncbi:MAG TPA: hypothetical protein VNS09_21510 [Solirubrobacter sp.]|nr:hypothetical protein [Solirubrobacter sp.]